MTPLETEKVLVFEYVMGLLGLAYTDEGTPSEVSQRLEQKLQDPQLISDSFTQFNSKWGNDFSRVKAMDLFYSVITHESPALTVQEHIDFVAQFDFRDLYGLKNIEPTIYEYFDDQGSRDYIRVYNGYSKMILPAMSSLVMREFPFDNNHNLTMAKKTVIDWLTIEEGKYIHELRRNSWEFQTPPPIGQLNYLIHDIE